MHGRVEAQERRDTLRTRADTLRADSSRADSLRTAQDSLTPEQRKARADSIEAADRRLMAAQRRRADSVKAPTAAAEMPTLTDVGESYRWDREALFASAALTLGDLLERVPGLTVFRSGWLGAPQGGALMGDFERVRVFYDGIELDPLDPRTGGMPDLSYVQLWPLEEVRIERGAGEIRVHLRSWRVRSVTPNTRVDIGTGDIETNAYRGYFGRRFTHGEVLQLGAFQYSTRDPRGVGDADQLSLFGRLGWARGRFSADGSFLRTARERTLQPRLVVEGQATRAGLPALDATQAELYARVAYTDTSRGVWAQFMAASIRHSQNNLAYDSTPPIPVDPGPERLDLNRPQYVAAFGWNRGALALSSTTRLRRIDAETFVAPSFRAAYELPRLAVALFAEQQPERDERRLELSARFFPLSWVALGGAVGQYAATGASPRPGTRAVRAEIGLRLRRAWLTAGMMTRDTAVLMAPVVFDTGYRAVSAGGARGIHVGVRGKIWKDVGLDVTAMRWDSAGAYRPEYRTRSQLYVNSGIPRRFPSGNFNILASLTHEYRTAVPFPLADAEPMLSSQYRTIDFLLEIRLLQATLSYQFRNLWNAQYEQVPRFLMHRPVQVYGVRWQFFN